MREALEAERDFNLGSNLLNALGGGTLGYAAFAGKMGERIAVFDAALVMAAVLLQCFSNLRRWIDGKKGS